MASTYSDLKIELIGNGEQSGTWGTTTNTNLGTAIEEAIVGRATANFTTDADLTISLTDTNATQVARHYILNVTSGVSLSTTRNLIVPTIDKPYIIENNTTGSQSIVVKTSAGTGVTVPNGARVMVYANSTNVVAAQTHIPSLTLGSALSVASGGTGTTTLTADNVILGNGTSAVQFVAPGTSGNILTSNGTTWTSSTGGGNTTANIGYLNIPQNSQSAAYTLVLADSGKHIFHPSADTTARTFTIPANGTVAFPVGTAVTFINQNGAGVVTISITTDTMRLAGAGTTGSRTLAANGVATAVKVTSTEWIISGTGLT